VGATLAEFRRALGLAHPGLTEAGEGVFSLADGRVHLVIRATPGRGRRLGLFELPLLQVSYRFEGGSADDCRAFLARLDRAMQRGGG
jgi:hypothetical protein